MPLEEQVKEKIDKIKLGDPNKNNDLGIEFNNTKDIICTLNDIGNYLVTDGSGSHAIYRGQSDYSWELESTLHRYTGKDNFCLNKYEEIIKEAFRAARIFNPKFLANLPEFKRGPYEISLPTSIPNAEYIVALRHLGFPAPIIDFTSSPAVALFFSCHENPDRDGKIFIYCDMPCNMAISSNGTDGPEYQHIGHYITAHPRHETQEASYIFPYFYNKQDSRYYFSKKAPCNLKFQSDDSIYHKTLLTLKIKSEMKLEILKYLDLFNLNSQSLFHDTENMLKTLAFRNFNK